MVWLPGLATAAKPGVEAVRLVPALDASASGLGADGMDEEEHAPTARERAVIPTIF